MRRLIRAVAVASALTVLASCAAGPRPTTPSPVPSGPPPAPAPGPGPAPVVGTSPASLPGWSEEDHRAALAAYAAGCGVARDPAGRAVCDRARALRSPGAGEARAFLETNFTVQPVATADGGTGLLTSYFAPEYAARRRPDAEFDMPVLGRPSDLVRGEGGVKQRRPDGSAIPYPDRAAIEAGAAVGAAPVLGWMRAEDLFFMQIQGSGYLTFEDGGRARAAYAADNGHPFTGIARPMAQQGLLPQNGTSGEAIRAWLAAHRGAEARAVTALNPRYIFFAVSDDDGGHPAGAAGVPLPPRRAVAVDPGQWRYGEAAWIEADAGNLRGARSGYRGLVMALDTGSAIRGPVRADLYMGRGDAAGDEAGTVRHPLRMWRLIPRG